MQLEGYTDLTRINRGGMAAIYRGRQTSLNRTVAIKYLSAEYLWDKQAKQLFEQESLVIAQLNHPNIVHVIDRGFSSKGRPYFVMEYIDGKDLSVRMQEQSYPATEKIELMIQACKGLAFAHKNGVVHRDIKPANLLIDHEGHLKVLDFGIAWLSKQGQPSGQEIVGTPDYMSPEQFNSPDTVSASSDIYSLGAVMYHLFTGRTQTSTFPDWQKPLSSLPSSLAALIEECLQSESQKRPASADEVRIRLLSALNGAHLGDTQKREAQAVLGKANNNFRLLDIIGRSRFGAVYLFEDQRRKQTLVIKKRVKSHAGYQAARALSALEHPHIVAIHGTSKNSKAFIVVMSHLTGGNLRERLPRRYSVEKFLEFAFQLCAGMAFAHQRNIVHGNLQPENILFDQHEQVHISDFGFDARLSNKYAKHYQLNTDGSPSVLRDIYSAGAVFHHLLTGEEVAKINGRLRVTDNFRQLDAALQDLLRNMLEPTALTHIESFDDIVTKLDLIKTQHACTHVTNTLRTYSRRKKIAVLLTLALLTSSIFVSVDEFLRSEIKNAIEAWLAAIASWASPPNN